jgi:predicted ABC-type transport system involved in lysophospholipase L1 biosynthesis ATPase subunit
LTAVRATNVVKSYGGKEAEVVALRGVTFEVGAAERVALLGKSGSGKSTLLNLLGGLDRPSSGELNVAGNNLAKLSPAELAHFRSVSVGMIFQGFNLIPSRTALSNVELPMVFTGQPKRQRLKAARQALEAVGLGKRVDHHPAELSGGECQRVAVARALVNRPAVLLADEPTGNLDSATAAEVMSYLLAHVRDHGATMILVTHDEELARNATDRTVRLKDGEVVQQ